MDITFSHLPHGPCIVRTWTAWSTSKDTNIFSVNTWCDRYLEVPRPWEERDLVLQFEVPLCIVCIALKFLTSEDP